MLRLSPGSRWAQQAPLRHLLDLMADAVLLFDLRGALQFANTAALRSLGVEAGQAPQQWGATLGEDLRGFVLAAVASGSLPGKAAPREFTLPDGRRARGAWQPLDGSLAALRLQIEAASAPPPAAPTERAADGEIFALYWRSSFPVSVQDEAHRIVDVNRAYLEFTGFTREQLIGRDPITLLHEDDQPLAREVRERRLGGEGSATPPDRRLIDATGRERWYRAHHAAFTADDGRRLTMSVLQDTTAEHAARERADRSAREIDHWFDLSPVGMVLFDGAGLLVRTNPAFDALAGQVPVLLGEASPALQHLLGWHEGAPAPSLGPGSPPMVVQGWLPDARGGGPRRLRSTVRCHLTPGGQRRYMAVVEDRSIEEERDLAQMQIGALMDTARVGVATFQSDAGLWHQPAAGSGGAGSEQGGQAALQSISRDIVQRASLHEYDRLQQALRRGERAEVRYAVQHPEMGERWLLTRVEPAQLASGQRTTSVVTLDITEQQRTQARNEQLLHELTTILETSSAGIAYLRGDELVRCNRRFQSILGLDGRDITGERLSELFGGSAQAQGIAADTLQALTEGVIYETEFRVDDLAGPQWFALSVRRTGEDGGELEAIAVLSDITRLKLQQQELELVARDRELMFSLSEVGIAFIRNGQIQRANEAMSQLSGYAPRELVGLAHARLFAEGAEHWEVWSHEEEALQRMGRWTGERQLHRRDGRLMWVQVSKRLVVEDDPSQGMIAAYVNVDDRHRAEAAVVHQAERTRAILDSVLVGIVTVGPHGIEWMNRSARRMFGGDLADFVDQPISTVATPEPDHPFRRTRYLEELAEGQAETFECRVKARDGREFWVVGNAVATGEGPGGRQLTYALLDIERRRQAEARTVEAQASLQRIIETAPMAITLRDARSLRVLQTNALAADILGTTADALIGKTPEEMYGPRLGASRRRDMEAALARPEQVTAYEHHGTHRGQRRIWDSRYLPLSSPGQPPDQLLLVATDVTEQRAAQQASFEAELAQREMLVKEVHHRIKNNLQGVAGLLQQIAAKKPEVAPVISEVVGQVQAIAQVYGLQVGAAGPLRVKSVVEAIAGSVQRTFGVPIGFSVHGAQAHRWALPEAESIPIALTVNELLTNAVKHCAARGAADAIHCRVEFEDDHLAVVIDNLGALPAGFSLAALPGGVTGLGLVRSLLPRRSASLALTGEGDRVVTRVTLRPPSVVTLDPA